MVRVRHSLCPAKMWAGTVPQGAWLVEPSSCGEASQADFERSAEQAATMAEQSEGGGATDHEDAELVAGQVEEEAGAAPMGKETAQENSAPSDEAASVDTSCALEGASDHEEAAVEAPVDDFMVDALCVDASGWVIVSNQPYGKDSRRTSEALLRDGLPNTLIQGHFVDFKVLATVPDLQATAEIMLRMLKDDSSEDTFMLGAKIWLSDATCWIPRSIERTRVTETDFVISLVNGFIEFNSKSNSLDDGQPESKMTVLLHQMSAHACVAPDLEIPRLAVWQEPKVDMSTRSRKRFDAETPMMKVEYKLLGDHTADMVCTLSQSNIGSLPPDVTMRCIKLVGRCAQHVLKQDLAQSPNRQFSYQLCLNRVQVHLPAHAEGPLDYASYAVIEVGTGQLGLIYGRNQNELGDDEANVFSQLPRSIDVRLQEVVCSLIDPGLDSTMQRYCLGHPNPASLVWRKPGVWSCHNSIQMIQCMATIDAELLRSLKTLWYEITQYSMANARPDSVTPNLDLTFHLSCWQSGVVLQRRFESELLPMAQFRSDEAVIQAFYAGDRNSAAVEVVLGLEVSVFDTDNGLYLPVLHQCTMELNLSQKLSERAIKLHLLSSPVLVTLQVPLLRHLNKSWVPDVVEDMKNMRMYTGMMSPHEKELAEDYTVRNLLPVDLEIQVGDAELVAVATEGRASIPAGSKIRVRLSGLDLSGMESWSHEISPEDSCFVSEDMTACNTFRLDCTGASMLMAWSAARNGMELLIWTQYAIRNLSFLELAVHWPGFGQGKSLPMDGLTLVCVDTEEDSEQDQQLSVSLLQDVASPDLATELPKGALRYSALQACSSLVLQGSTCCFGLSATVHKGDGECWRTTFITFDPKYTLINASDKALHILYEGQSELPGEDQIHVTVQPGQSEPLWLPADVVAPRARARLSDEYEWSNTFLLDSVGEHYLRSRKVGSLLPVVLGVQVLVAGGLKATFEAEGLLTPFQIRNKSQYTLRYCQNGCAQGEEMDILPPRTTVPYTWENPEQHPELLVMIDAVHGCKLTQALVTLDSIQGPVESHDGRVTSAAVEQPFLFVVLEDSLKIEHVIHLSVHSRADGCNVLVCWELTPSPDTQMVVVREVEELWENQRRVSPWDDYSHKKLMPSDRGQYSDCDGKPSSFEQLDASIEDGWTWEDSSWTASEEYQYAFNWHDHHKKWHTSSSLRMFVRRRLWRRARVQALLPPSVFEQVEDFRPPDPELWSGSVRVGTEGWALPILTNGALGEAEEGDEEQETIQMQCFSSPLSELDMVEASEGSFEFSLRIVLVCFSLVSVTGDPLATLSLGGVDSYFSRIKNTNKAKDEAWNVNVTIDTVQIDDDHDNDARFPIVLSLEHFTGKPLLQVVCSGRLHSGAMAELPFVSMLIQPLQVNLDECLAMQLLELWNFLALEVPSSPSGVLRCRVGRMLLQPVRIILSFRRAPRADFVSKASMRASFGYAFANVSESPLNFDALHMEDVTLTSPVLVQLVTDHYSGLLRQQLARLFGASDVLGNPIGVAQSFKRGVTSFMYEPSHGVSHNRTVVALQRAGAVGGGVLKGTVVGSMGFANAITATLSKSFAVLSFDDKFVETQSREQRSHYGAVKSLRRPVGAAFGYGLKSLGKGVLEGLAGIVVQPVQGAQKEGIKGFAKGVGKGIAGVVAKPVSGAIDVAAGSICEVGGLVERIGAKQAPVFRGCTIRKIEASQRSEHRKTLLRPIAELILAYDRDDLNKLPDGFVPVKVRGQSEPALLRSWQRDGEALTIHARYGTPHDSTCYSVITLLQCDKHDELLDDGHGFSILSKTINGRKAVFRGPGRSRWMLAVRSPMRGTIMDENIIVHLECCTKRDHSAVAPTTSSICTAGPLCSNEHDDMIRQQLYLACCTRRPLFDPLFGDSAVAALEQRLSASYISLPITSLCVIHGDSEAPPEGFTPIWRTWGAGDARLGWGSTPMYICAHRGGGEPPITEVVVGCTLSESLEGYEMIERTPSGLSADLDGRSLFVGVCRDPAHGAPITDVQVSDWAQWKANGGWKQVVRTCGYVAFGSKYRCADG